MAVDSGVVVVTVVVVLVSVLEVLLLCWHPARSSAAAVTTRRRRRIRSPFRGGSCERGTVPQHPWIGKLRRSFGSRPAGAQDLLERGAVEAVPRPAGRDRAARQ